MAGGGLAAAPSAGRSAHYAGGERGGWICTLGVGHVRHTAPLHPPAPPPLHQPPPPPPHLTLPPHPPPLPGLNAYIILVAIVGGAGGLLFGYDIGVTGGVTSMAQFQQVCGEGGGGGR